MLTKEVLEWGAKHVSSGRLEDGTPWIAIPNPPEWLEQCEWSPAEIREILRYRKEHGYGE